MPTVKEEELSFGLHTTWTQTNLRKRLAESCRQQYQRNVHDIVTVNDDMTRMRMLFIFIVVHEHVGTAKKYAVIAICKGMSLSIIVFVIVLCVRRTKNIHLDYTSSGRKCQTTGSKYINAFLTDLNRPLLLQICTIIGRRLCLGFEYFDTAVLQAHSHLKLVSADQRPSVLRLVFDEFYCLADK